MTTAAKSSLGGVDRNHRVSLEEDNKRTFKTGAIRGRHAGSMSLDEMQQKLDLRSMVGADERPSKVKTTFDRAYDLLGKFDSISHSIVRDVV